MRLSRGGSIYKKKSEFLGIQALRCLAALMVVITHATDIWADHVGIYPRPATWGNGTAGVDIFFVISGFVMMTSSNRLLDSPHPARIFLWRRIVRIVPLYWILTTLKLLIIKSRPALAMHAAPSIWNICASYLFLPSYAGSGDIRPVLPVGWTLNFEMLFYVLFACALVFRIRVLYVLLPVLGILSWGAFYRTSGGPAITAFADPIVLDFIAGVLVALFLEKIQSIYAGAMALAGCVAMSGILAFVPYSSISFERIGIYGGGAAVIVAATVACETHLARVLPRWVLLLGDASYSIYLVQSFALPVAGALLIQAGLFSGRLPVGLVEGACVVVGTMMTLVMAVPMYKLIEYPATMALKKVKV